MTYAAPEVIIDLEEKVKMKSVILIALVIFIYTAQSFLCKKYGDYYPGRKELASPTFTVVSGLLVCLLTLIYTRFSFDISPMTWFFGLVNALALAGYNTFLLRASRSGAYSVMMVSSIAGGITIPTIVTFIAFRDPLSPLRALSLALVFAAVYLMSHKKQDAAIKNKSFLLFCLGLGICNGIYGTMLDAQQRITGIEEKEMMVAITYFGAFVFSLSGLIIKEGRHIPSAFRQNKKSLAYLIASSLVVAVAVNLLVYILPLVNVTVLYTFENAGVLLLSVIASHLFFREALSVKNIVGCVLMCLALVGVALF